MQTDDMRIESNIYDIDLKCGRLY